MRTDILPEGGLEMLLFQLKEYQKTELPISAWLENPDRLYQKEHVHDCYEMVLVCRGTGWCAVNGRRFPMLHGDLYVLRPGDLHEFTNNPGMRFYNVMFSDGMLSAAEIKILEPVLKKYGKYTFSASVFDRLTSLLAELCSELQFSRPGQNLAVKAVFLRFLLELLRNRRIVPLPKQPGGDPRPAARLLDLVIERCREKLTLDDLASVTGGSPEYAGRLFKKLTGITFSDYLARCRIELACVRLKNTSASISEIAAELGYYDIAYFDKCFKKIIGITPSTYRMNLAAGGSVQQS